ncbi:MAG TPA: DegT/DnrJ/EryC1/StrS aminotransferase family protein [bacterium]|nr:DegT/DnrJ/EryC1/StrS aminotransferase family protein [bacterium]
MEKLALFGGKPIRKEFLVFGAPDIKEKEIKEVVATLKSGWLSTGPRVAKFEEDFKNYIGCKHAIALNSCTAGLHLALEIAGIGRGDEVITTPLTFASTANVIIHQGATPIFVDVEKETGNIDPQRIEEFIKKKCKVNTRTGQLANRQTGQLLKAIIPVHLYGRPCKMDEIMKIAKENNLLVIEDAAHAVETYYKGKKIGNIGDLTAFSFYATKNVVTGEGGMLTTNNDEWTKRLRVLRLHGLSKDAWKRYSQEGFTPYDILYPGYKYNMMDIQAAIGIHQLKRVEENLKIREKYFRMYNKAFSSTSEIKIPIEEENIRHARHLYTILLKLEKLKCDRNQMVVALQAENIGIGIHFLTIHLSSYYKKRFGFKKEDFPQAEYISDRTLSLPLSTKLTEEDINDVIEAVRKVIKHYKR